MDCGVHVDLRAATLYECCNDPEDIDKFRHDLVKEWIVLASDLQERKIEMLADNHLQDCTLRAKLHTPFLSELLRRSKHPAPEQAMDLLFGSLLFGQLDPCMLEATP